jgi:H+-transporting ATPase
MAEQEKVDLGKKWTELHSSKDGLTSEDAKKRLEQYGRNELPEKKESKLKKFLKTYWGPIPWLIEVAAILSAVIKHWPDFIVITFMLVLNSLVEFVQENKASNALAALKSSMALKARVMRDGKWQTILAKDLVPGDMVNLENGDIVPADCVLASGEYLSVDQAALTGESLPANKQVSEVVYSGSIVKQGNMTALVTGTGLNTFFGRTAKLVQSAGTVSHFQKSVMNIGKFLIFGALLFAILIIAKELYLHQHPLEIVELVLVLVIASIPVAMPAVLSVTMALGALMLSKKKAIVSRLQAIEELAGVDILCSDKTGTLTKNELTLYKPTLYSAKDADELTLMAALASSQTGKDVIDAVIVKGAGADKLKPYEQEKFIPFDPVSKKTQATVKYKDTTFQVAKGAPQVIIELSKETDDVKKKALADVHELAVHGLRALGVAKTDEHGDFRLLGILSLYDPPRDDSKEVIAETKSYGIEVKMVTGDDVAIGQEICSELGLGTHLLAASEVFADAKDMDHLPHDITEKIIHADGFARVFPEHKYGIVKAYQQNDEIVAMTGDGVNDAPALKQADVGIAVSGATDAARSAAALILTLPGLSVITTAIQEARKIFERMISYVNYRVTMTIDIMVFVTLSILFTNIVPVTAIMIVMLALLDDIPIIAIAYDNTRASKDPVKWQLGKVLFVASVLGLVSVGENFGLMYLARDYLVSDARVLQTVIFLQLIVAGHLLLFISRHKSWFWMPPWPSIKLLGAIITTQIIAVLICRFGLFVPAISWSVIGWVWAYAVIWMFILNVVRKITDALYEYHDAHKRFATLNKTIHQR